MYVSRRDTRVPGTHEPKNQNELTVIKREISGVTQRNEAVKKVMVSHFAVLLGSCEHNTNANAKHSNRAGLSILDLLRVIPNDFQGVYTSEVSLRSIWLTVFTRERIYISILPTLP